MFDPKSLKQSKPEQSRPEQSRPEQSRPAVALTSKNPPAKLAIMASPVPTQDKIRERAYELYESRGREPGQDEQDWFRAENELLK
jgi:hypothetical protein